MFDDQRELEEDIEMLVRLGFVAPKWAFRTNVPLAEISCATSRHLCDIVAFRDGTPILAIERDGCGHTEEKQKKYDAIKDFVLQKHGIRIWRWWNGTALDARNQSKRIFRRDIKTAFYAPWGALKSDFHKLCDCTKTR